MAGMIYKKGQFVFVSREDSFYGMRIVEDDGITLVLESYYGFYETETITDRKIVSLQDGQ